MKEALIFVYNADSGYFNLAADIAHKIFSPATYPCHLCDITYGVFKIRPVWEKYVQQAQQELIFLHRDEFHAQFPEWKATPLPLVLRRRGEQLELFLDAAALEQIVDAEGLIRMLEGRQVNHPLH